VRTTEFSATFGVVPGFGHDNDEDDPVLLVAKIWNKAAAAERSQNGMYIAAVLKICRVLYPQEKGSPEGGEIAVEVTGARNPRCEDAAAWRESVHRVAEATRTALAQATVRIIFRDVDDDLLEG